jgi:hypothetical protein
VLLFGKIDLFSDLTKEKADILAHLRKKYSKNDRSVKITRSKQDYVNSKWIHNNNAFIDKCSFLFLQ